jgi:hypothetical protein
MTGSFWIGFEKRAYDYAQEAKDLEQEERWNSKLTPFTKTKGGLVGAGVGAGLGALIGGITGHHNAIEGGRVGAGLGALIGLGGGAALGGLMGVSAAITNKLGIEESKRIMAMEPAKRRMYLQSLARKNEISEREAHDWSRDAEKERNDERRHRESMGRSY